MGAPKQTKLERRSRVLDHAVLHQQSDPVRLQLCSQASLLEENRCCLLMLPPFRRQRQPACFWMTERVLAWNHPRGQHSTRASLGLHQQR